MREYLDRIDRFNPTVNAIVSLRPHDELIAEAREADAALARGESCGWMHGFPIAIKDLSATADIRTTQHALTVNPDHPMGADHVLWQNKMRGLSGFFLTSVVLSDHFGWSFIRIVAIFHVLKRLHDLFLPRW